MLMLSKLLRSKLLPGLTALFLTLPTALSANEPQTVDTPASTGGTNGSINDDGNENSAEADSLTFGKALAEITVEGNKMTVLKNGLIVRPTNRERKTAFDQFALLNMLQLPVLNVDPINHTVKTNTGQNPAYFINGMAASDFEVQAIRPKDVLQIKVLRNPPDAIYQGAPAVIDFIMKQYNYGGYVLANGRQSFIRNAGNYSLYAKYQQNRSIVQASASASYENESGSHSTTTTAMNMLDKSGRPWELVSDESSMLEYKRKRNYSGIIKWITYGLDSGNQYLKYQFSLTGGISAFRMPTLWNGKVAYNIDHYTDYSSSTYNKSSSCVPFVNLNYMLSCSQRLQLNVAAASSASFNNGDYSYTAENLDSPIDNSSRETAWNHSASISLTYYITNKTIIQPYLSALLAQYTTDYTGSANTTQKLWQNNYSGGLSLWQSIGQNWTMQASATIPVTSIRTTDGTWHNETDFTGGLSINGRINDKHSIYFSFNAAHQIRPISTYNTFEQDRTEFESITGNTRLKLSPFYSGNLSYTFVLNNNINFSLAAQWRHITDDPLIGYFPKDDRMYSGYVNNNGYYEEENFTVRSSIALFDRKLQLQPAVNFYHVYHSGLYPMDKFYASPALSATFIPDNHFSISLYGEIGKSYLFMKSQGDMVTYPDPAFSISGSYNYRNLGIELKVNPFLKYRKSTHTLNSPYINRISEHFDKWGGRQIEISARWIFDYGRRLEHQPSTLLPQGSFSSVRE